MSILKANTTLEAINADLEKRGIDHVIYRESVARIPEVGCPMTTPVSLTRWRVTGSKQAEMKALALAQSMAQNCDPRKYTEWELEFGEGRTDTHGRTVALR